MKTVSRDVEQHLAEALQSAKEHRQALIDLDRHIYELLDLDPLASQEAIWHAVWTGDRDTEQLLQILGITVEQAGERKGDQGS